MDPVAERLAAAKLWLISQSTARGPDAPRDLPYLAHALYALIPVPTSEVTSMRADEHWRLYVSPTWIVAADIPQVGREIAHLAWHLLMDHADRGRAQGVDRTTAEHWHVATDLTVDDTLGADAPADLHDRAERARRGKVGRLGRGRSAEEYYAVLSGLPVPPPDSGPAAAGDNDQAGCGSACDGIARSGDLPPDDDTGRVTRVGADFIRKRVAIDYQEHVTTRGTTPGEALRWARSITNPTIPWEPLLARAVRRAVGWTSGRYEPTWTRPSRRASSLPTVLLPGMRRPVPHVAMVLDTSGSIDDGLLGRAMGEVDGALRGLGVPGASVLVYACDAAVGAVTRVRRAADANLVGGGGTDLRVGIAAASEHKPRPNLIVVFTDGYTPWPATPPPGSAVIAAMLRRPDQTLPAVPTWATRIDCVLAS